MRHRRIHRTTKARGARCFTFLVCVRLVFAFITLYYWFTQDAQYTQTKCTRLPLRYPLPRLRLPVSNATLVFAATAYHRRRAATTAGCRPLLPPHLSQRPSSVFTIFFAACGPEKNYAHVKTSRGAAWGACAGGAQRALLGQLRLYHRVGPGEELRARKTLEGTRIRWSAVSGRLRQRRPPSAMWVIAFFRPI